MRSWLNPILFFAAAGYLRHYNSTRTDSAMVFPFIDVVAGPKLADQQQASFYLLLGLGALTTLVALYDTFRVRPSKKPAE